MRFLWVWNGKFMGGPPATPEVLVGPEREVTGGPPADQAAFPRSTSNAAISADNGKIINSAVVRLLVAS